MTHEEITKLAFFIEPTNGNRIAADNTRFMDPTQYKLAFGPRVTIDEKYMNLLTSAPTLYQALTYQFQKLEALIAALEPMTHEQSESGQLAKATTGALVELQNGCMLAQRVSQVGLTEVADSLKRGQPERR